MERAASPWRGLGRRSALAGLLSVALLGAGAQASHAQSSVQFAVANNMYPLLTNLSGHLASTYTFSPFTFNAASQAGGYWRDGTVDTTTLRGITSGSARQQIVGPGPYTTCNPTSPNPNPNCEQGPLQIDAFFSADEANVNAVIPTASGGTCTVNGTTVTVCPGIAATKTPVAIGQLAVYRCSATYATNGADPGSPGAPVGAVNGSGNGEPNSRRCEAAPVTLSTNNMAGVVNWLSTSGNRISIADPAAAPFGAASRQALINAGFSYNTSGGSQNVWPAAQCDAQGSACKVRLEAGISQVRGAVTSATTQLGLAAVSNLRNITWTSGMPLNTTNDPNPWFQINASAYSTGYGPIAQYAVGIRRSTPDTTAETRVANMLSSWNSDSIIASRLALYGY